MKLIWSLLLVGMLALTMFAQTDASQVPAFHSTPPPKTDKLPPILAQSERTAPAFTHDYQDHAYELAAKIPNVIYQLPCYCYCDRAVGHKSLHSCYESAHGAHCSTCLKELYFAYLETKKGKTPAQIRAAIIKGDWEQIDLTKASEIE
jgi:Protein of unknown function with PCYCGC motif